MQELNGARNLAAKFGIAGLGCVAATGQEATFAVAAQLEAAGGESAGERHFGGDVSRCGLYSWRKRFFCTGTGRVLKSRKLNIDRFQNSTEAKVKREQKEVKGTRV